MKLFPPILIAAALTSTSAFAFEFSFWSDKDEKAPVVSDVPPVKTEAPIPLPPKVDLAKVLGEYTLAAGDMITVKVFNEPELSLEKVRLNKSGAFSYPFLGEVNVTGMNINQVEQKIERELKGRYLVNPKVSASIDEYRPFFIDGEVNRPGGYSYQPGLTVRRAAALAGGLTERADMKKISVIKESDPQKRSMPSRLDQEVLPGDTIFIGQTFF